MHCVQVWNATLGAPWPISPHAVFLCLNVVALAMLALAFNLPASLDTPKAELLTATAGAPDGGGGPKGGPGGARERRGGKRAAGLVSPVKVAEADDEKRPLVHEADV